MSCAWKVCSRIVSCHCRCHLSMYCWQVAVAYFVFHYLRGCAVGLHSPLVFLQLASARSTNMSKRSYISCFCYTTTNTIIMIWSPIDLIIVLLSLCDHHWTGYHAITESNLTSFGVWFPWRKKQISRFLSL